MSKYYNSIKKILHSHYNIVVRRGLIVLQCSNGILNGIYLENLPNGIRVWDFLLPAYHGDSEINFQYSKISKFDFISDITISEKKQQFECAKKLKHYLDKYQSLEEDSLINYVNEMDIDKYSKLRFNMFYYIFQKKYDLALKLKETVDLISQDICHFEWHRDTLNIWHTFVNNPDLAREILLDRGNFLIENLSIQ